MFRLPHPLLSAALTLATALPALPQGASSERYPNSGASVPDNRQASDMFDRVTTLLHNGRTQEGVSKLVELQDRYGDKLVLFGVEGQYVSCRRLVDRLTRTMTPEALTAWRSWVDPRVDAMIRDARGPRDYRRILRDYAMATRALEVHFRLADALSESGDLEGAAEVLADVLELPGAEPRAATAAARLALVLGALNDPEGLAALEERMKGRLGDAVRFRGREAVLGNAFAAARTRLRVTGDEAPAWAAWPTLGGSGSRDRVAAGLRSVPAPTARYELRDGATKEIQLGFSRTGPLGSGSGELMPVVPAVSDGVMVVNEGWQAWAAELVGEGDRRTWVYSRALPPRDIMPEERALHAATIDRGRAYFCVVGSAERQQEQLGWLTVVYPIPVRRLVCADVQTGRVLWEKGGDADGKTFERRASYHGAPVADGDRIYCAATYAETPTDPVGHWVACFDAKTGAELWRTFLASGIQEINLFGNNTRESVPHSLTVTRDRIYACTNLGVVACVDRTDGGLLWARRYPRYQVKPIVDPYEIPRLPVSWANNPIYAALDPRDGKQKVVVAPMDGPYLLCLSAEQGDLLWKFPCYDVEFAEEDVHRRAAEPPTLYRYVLGVRDGVVYLSGQRAAAISLTGMKRVWAPVNLQGPSSGRGVVAADGVYIPQRGGVKKLGLKRPDEGMETLRWPSDVEPGNLVLVEQALVAAGREAVTVCYDPAKVRAFYTSEIQKNPSSAYLRYRLALCLLQAGETQAAEDALKAALDLARRRSDEDSAAIVEACRRTLFRNRMSSASVFLRRTDGGRRAVEEIEKARAYAATDGDWLELLFELSRAHRQANQPAEAVAALQEIVEKHGLVLLDAQEPARDRAAREIAALLARHGREAYAPFEDQARAALEIARRDADPAAFEDVLRRFPNSLAAEDAACGVGRARFAAGDWTGACEAFGRFLREYPASRLVPQATAELATAYEKRGMLAMAGAQLRRLKKQHADAEIQMEGGRVSAGKWAEAKLAGAAFAKSAGAGAAPALTWPAKKTWTWTGQRAWDTAVVVPRGDGGWKAPVALVMTGGRVAVLHIGSGKELWQAAGPAQARFAAFSSGLLVVAGATDIQAYRETGETAWRASHGGNVLGCAVEAEGSVYLAARDFRNRCFVAAYDASTGQQSWEAELASGHFVQDLWVMEDRVAWRSRDETSLILADRESGAVRSRFALLASRLLPAGPDRFLAVPAPDRLSLIDAGTGKPVWSQPCPGLWLDQPPEVRGGTAVALAMEDESFRLRGFDLETGKLLYSTDLGGIWPKQFLADERTVWVVLKSVDPPHAFTAYAYELRSGKRLWETPLPGVTSLYPGLLSRDEVILNAPMFRKDETGAGRWVPTLIALDKETGTESGRIEGRPASTPTYKVELAPGRVLMTQDETVEGWGR